MTGAPVDLSKANPWKGWWPRAPACVPFMRYNSRGDAGLLRLAPKEVIQQVQIVAGVIQWDGKPVIKGYIEKPTYDYCASMGVYVFDPRVLKYIPRSDLDFPDLMRMLIKSGEKVVGYPFDGYWLDLGRPDDYELAVQDFEKMRTEFLPEEATRELANPAI